MKLHFIVAGAVLFIALLSAGADTLEATTKRVDGLEKAILISQEDQSKISLDQNTLRGNLRKAITDLNSEITARQELARKLDAANTSRNELAASLAKEIADRQALAIELANIWKAINETPVSIAALNLKVDGIKANLNALSGKSELDMAGAMKIISELKTAMEAGDRANSTALTDAAAKLTAADKAQNDAQAEQKKTFDDQLTALKKDFDAQIAQLKADTTAKLDKQQADFNAKLADQKAVHDAQIAELTKSLEDERVARSDALKLTAAAQAKIKKQQKQDQVVGILGFLTAIIIKH